MKIRHFLLLALCAMSGSMQAERQVTVIVSNPLRSARTDQPVVLSLAQYGLVRSAVVTTDGTEIPCQLDDFNQDDVYDELCFLANLDSKQTKTYTVLLQDTGEPRIYPARVYAEMVMRNDKVKEKNKHNNYIESITARGDCANSYNLQHHHGVCFESELNGIRIYFDKRQTLDLYGKFKRRLELHDTQFYTQQDQKQNGYGDDVLWVGNSFGLGAFRGWSGSEPTMVEPVKSRTQRIVSYGPLRTIVEIIDRGWQATAGQPTIDMTLRYTQYAGHRDTDIDVIFSHPAANHQFSTGIINVKGSEEMTDHRGLRGCWGTDWPSTDTVKWNRETVGLGIYIPRKYIVSEQPANSDNYAYVVQTATERMQYKVAYCSANEDFGPHSATDWFAWLKQWRREIESPIIIRLATN